MKFFSGPRFIKYAALALVLIFVLIGAALFVRTDAGKDAAPTPTPAAQPTKAPKVVPAFSSADLDGNAVDQTVFENAAVTFVNIWGTFCGPCINEMPDLGELAKEYADKGVQFIGIIADASAETPDELALAAEIRESTGADYLHILNSESVHSAMLTRVSAIPTSFFVNSAGEIISTTYVGAKSKADWQKEIDKILDAQS